ncbi:MAG: short-chain dehydrogenase [Nitrospirae bacterium GWC2_57_13]|jgi:NAD(P)-dependent dehydrogenase (short-subunit alcohol dehydrogenase family)|nr:MAG: short-chain dehydrogenase [Nitrospirae bacterium GWC2_57_13]
MTSNKVALVTGANKGLGLAASRHLAQQGITVLMGSRNAAKGKAAVKLLQQEGLAVEFIQIDVTKSEQIRKAAAEIKKRFGKLDILVNNAGMVSKEEPLVSNSAGEIKPRELRKVFDANFFGLVEVTQALLPLIKKSGSGNIVNISSILGSLALQSKDSEMAAFKPFAYDASKTAVNAFTVHLAAALKDTTIKVNSAHPGWVRTDMGGPQAPIMPEEGAKTAVRLATLGPDGPTGKFYYGDDELPW